MELEVDNSVKEIIEQAFLVEESGRKSIDIKFKSNIEIVQAEKFAKELEDNFNNMLDEEAREELGAAEIRVV